MGTLCPLQGPPLEIMATRACTSERRGEEDVWCTRHDEGHHTGWIRDHPGRPNGGAGTRQVVSEVGGWLGCVQAWGQPGTVWAPESIGTRNWGLQPGAQHIPPSSSF